MAKTVIYAKPSDKAIEMAPDDVSIRFKTSDVFADENLNVGAKLEQKTGKLSAPVIDSASFVTILKTLPDGTVVADVEFDISDIDGAEGYEVRFA